METQTASIATGYKYDRDNNLVARIDPWLTTLYRSQGHLLEVTDIVEKMQRGPGGLFPIFAEVIHEGKSYAIPQSVSPSPLVARMDILDAAKVEPPKTWDEFIEVCKKLQRPPKLTGYACRSRCTKCRMFPSCRPVISPRPEWI